MKKSTKRQHGGNRPGSGRKPLVEGEGSVVFSGKIPESLADRVDSLLGDTSRSALLRKLLEKWVKRQTGIS